MGKTFAIKGLRAMGLGSLADGQVSEGPSSNDGSPRRLGSLADEQVSEAFSRVARGVQGWVGLRMEQASGHCDAASDGLILRFCKRQNGMLWNRSAL